MTRDAHRHDPALARALSRLPSGVYVLTAGRGAAATGMLVTWVQQVGFEPPAVAVALRKGRAIEPLIRGDGAFCLAVLDGDGRAMLRHFARGFEPGADAFAGVEIAMCALGIPYPRAALAHLACRVRGVAADWTDHVVVCGEVAAGDGVLEREPMVHVRKNGFSY